MPAELVVLVCDVAPHAQDGGDDAAPEDLGLVAEDEAQHGDRPEEHGVLHEEEDGEPRHAEPYVARRPLPPGGVHARPDGVGEDEDHQEHGCEEERHASQDF